MELLRNMVSGWSVHVYMYIVILQCYMYMHVYYMYIHYVLAVCDDVTHL